MAQRTGGREGRAPRASAKTPTPERRRFVDSLAGRILVPVAAGLIGAALGYFFNWLQSNPRIEKLESAVVRQSQEHFALKCIANGGTPSGPDCIIPGVPVPERWRSPLEE